MCRLLSRREYSQTKCVAQNKILLCFKLTCQVNQFCAKMNYYLVARLYFVLELNHLYILPGNGSGLEVWCECLPGAETATGVIWC